MALWNFWSGMMLWSFVLDVSMPAPLVISILAGAAMSRALILTIRSDRHTDSSAHSTAYNRTIAAADF